MSTWGFGERTTWGGSPIARRIGDAQHRGRALVTGTVTSERGANRGPAVSCVYVLEDATGQIDVVFVGRHSVPGIRPGVRLSVEGTARMEGDRLALWNPLYRIEGS